jgi:nicotinate phosphoribosyltransferase
VEVEGVPSAKRGKLGGRKQVWRCPGCVVDVVRPSGEAAPVCPRCGGETEAMLGLLLKEGEIVGDLPEPSRIRESVLVQISRLGDSGA